MLSSGGYWLTVLLALVTHCFTYSSIVPSLLAGMVSMLPTVDNDLFQIEGGNVQVPKKLLDYAHAHMTTANVSHVTRLPNGSYTITSRQHGSTQVRPTYSKLCSQALSPCPQLHGFSHTCAGAAACDDGVPMRM